MVSLPRLAAKAFTSSAAGGLRFDASLTNTIVVDTPADGAGIGTGTTGGTGGGPAAAGRTGGAAGKAGGGPADGLPALAVMATAPAGVPAFAAGVVWAGADCGEGAGSGVLCTTLRGAGDGGAGGAVTAGMEALATGAPGDAPAADGGVDSAAAPGGGGGGAVPTPNRLGDAVGEDGSASGAASAACCALVRSATSDAVNCFISS